MNVVYFSPTQSCHDLLASLTFEELNNWESDIRDPIENVCTSIFVRIVAIANTSLFMMTDVVLFLPRVAVVTWDLASSNEIETGIEFFEKIAKVYVLAIIRLTLQGASFIGAIVLPEFVYGELKMQERLFEIELEFLLATMPKFPSVSYQMAISDTAFTEFGKIWKNIGLSDDHWQKQFVQEVREKRRQDSRDGSELLSFDYTALNGISSKIFIDNIIKQLNVLFQNNALEKKHVENMGATSFIRLQTKMPLRIQNKIIELNPDVQNEIDQAEAEREESSRYDYRSSKTIRMCNAFLTEMKKARKYLLDNKIFSQEELETCKDEPFSSVICIGLVNFIEAAKLSEDEKRLTFYHTDFSPITLGVEKQFFGSFERLLLLKKTVKSMNAAQKKALIERLCFSNARVMAAFRSISHLQDDSIVKKCYAIIGDLERNVIEKPAMRMQGVSAEAQTPWIEAFTCG